MGRPRAAARSPASVTAVFADGTRVPLEHVRSGIWEGTRSGGPGRYELVTTYADGAGLRRGRPLPAPADARRARPAPDRRGPARAAVERPRRARAHDGRLDGDVVRGVGAQRRAVRVVGDFNRWDGQGHAMRSMGGSGVWELFIPGIGAGTTYKFELLSRRGDVGAQGRPDGAVRRGAAGDSIRRRPVLVRVGRPGLDRAPPSLDAGVAADVGVRAAPRLVAARDCRTAMPPTSSSTT